MSQEPVMQLAQAAGDSNPAAGAETATQPAAPDAVPQGDAPAAGPEGLLAQGLENARELLSLGGPVVAVLIGLSLVALAICLVKLYQFSRARLWHGRRLHDALELWLAGNAQAAMSRLARLDNPAAATLMHAMRLELSGQNEVVVREEIERVAADGLREMRAYIRPLEVIAQVAPLIGLFGTVLGMITAFRSLQEAGSAVDPALLAGGIWVALLTTAAGLALAIPLNLIVSWFDGIIARHAHETEQLATRFFTGRRPAAAATPLHQDALGERRLAHAH